MQKLSPLVQAAVAIAAAAAFAPAARAQSSAQVWVAPSSQKVRPETQPPAGARPAATLAAAQNEFESFHVVVTGAASGVSMQLQQLDDGQGHVIAGRDVVLYREALIDVAQPSGGDGAAGRWPDALVPDVDPIAGEKRNAFPFDVPAGESRAVLVDLHVPQGAPAGTYTGTLSVSGGAAAQVPVTLTVWDFAVPSTSTLRSAFGLAWNGPCAGHGDGSCSGKGDSALRARYVQAALDDHVSIDVPSDAVPVAPDGTADWTTFDAEAGPFLDGTAPTRLAGAKLTSQSLIARAPATSAVAAEWGRHFTQRGWHGALFDYVCDEPPATCAWSDIAGRIAQLKAGDATIPALVTTTVQQAAQHDVTGIDLFAPVLNFVDDKSGAFAGSQRASYGTSTWWYQSCMSFGCAGVAGMDAGTAAYETGWPTMAIDADGTRNRAMEWLSFTYDMSGELYYETTQAYFSGDPWQTQAAFGGAGDGTLFYPGTVDRIGGQTEIPIESLRLKLIRDGMEDYELLALAFRLGKGPQAMQIAQGVYPRTFEAVATPQALDAARAELAGLILHALGKDVAPAPAPAPTPAPAPAPDPAPAPAPTAAPATTAANRPAAASVSPGAGCAAGGVDLAWAALPLCALLLRRRGGARG